MSDNLFDIDKYSKNFGEFLSQFNGDMNKWFEEKQIHEIASKEQVDSITNDLNNEFQKYMKSTYPDAEIVLIPQFNAATQKVEINLDPRNENGFNLMKEAFGDNFNDYVWNKETNKMHRYRSMVTVLNSKQVANLKSVLNILDPKDGQYIQIKTVDKGADGIKTYLYLDSVLLKDLDSE